jgi:polyvinyl alcohol dehydrogenase (cytochrome)
MIQRTTLLASSLAIGAILAFATALPGQQPAPDGHPGSAVYQARCAACHAGADPRAPALETLRTMTAPDLHHALTEGVMAVQGAELSAQERAAVVDYLAAMAEDSWVAGMMCPADQRRVDPHRPAAMARVGVDLTATRSLTAEQAGLSRGDMENLEVAWALAIPGVSGLRAAPVVVGSTVYYSTGAAGELLALDAETGCARWSYDSPTPLRSSLALAELGGTGRMALYFGDARGQVHALDAATGEALWVVNAQADPGVGNITGSVVVHDGKVIVPISASGVSAAANPRHECCAGRGAVTVLDAATGERLWVYFTMEEARYTGAVSSEGVPLRGPSGAPIWATPSVDPDRGVVYVASGQNTSLPATSTSNAIIALDLETGHELWVFQGIADDVWNMACTTSAARPSGPNCPSEEHSILKDWDFGGSPVLAQGADGREYLLAGQKSGHLWALDPDSGEVLWEQRVGDGSPLGGNHWGIAVDGQRVFMPINDPYFDLPDYEPVPGMYAFDVVSGESLWQHRVTSDCAGERNERVPQCSSRYGLSATPLVVDGAVVSASIDGRIFIFDGEDGRVLFEFDSARPFPGLNGIEGTGGSIDSHSIAAGAGMILIGSGYGSFSQPAGNVLLAFRPRAD